MPKDMRQIVSLLLFESDLHIVCLLYLIAKDQQTLQDELWLKNKRKQKTKAKKMF